MDVIRIDAELACIVGVRPHERRRRQKVRVTLTLTLDLSRAGRSGRITQTCDYAQVADEVTELLQFREYQLVEVATEELAAMLFGIHAAVEQVSIQIEKPDALRGRARAVVSIERRRADFPRIRQTLAYGEREVLLETHEASLYLVELDPGTHLEADLDDSARRLERLVSGELTRGRRPLRDGELTRVRGHGEPLENVGSRRAVLFVCRTPCLDLSATAGSPDAAAQRS